MEQDFAYAEIYNPYDFANPVSDRDLFSGRESELKDIRYYLTQAKSAPRPINIALLGPRAAGKTSLLNMIELDARELGFCVARVNLNEGDVESDLAFFFKVFDAIFSAACDFDIPAKDGAMNKCFGGKDGHLYDVYLDMVFSYAIPEDKIFKPFMFPIQYAKAMSGGVDSKISEQSFQKDLAAIRDKVGKPIVILFDECNVLSHKRNILQAVRNLFMNTRGYMMVFTGTPDLFPVMDEVFSPIIRQFKKVKIGSFNTEAEIEECITKPLESIGIFHPKRIFDRQTYADLTRLYDITSGKPHEVQLVCHFMFRQLQERKEEKMVLSREVLDNVLDEIRTGQDISSRHVLKTVLGLSSIQRKALSLLSAAGGEATFESIWFAEYTINGNKNFEKDNLYSHMSELIELGVLSDRDTIIGVNGDDFDRIYAKYFLRGESKPNPFVYHSMPYPVFFNLRFVQRLSELEYLQSIGGMVERDSSGTRPHLNFCELAHRLDNPSYNNVFDLNHPQLEILYFQVLSLSRSAVREAFFINVSVKIEGMNFSLAFCFEQDEEVDRRAEIETLLTEMKDRAIGAGGTLEIHIKMIKVPVEERLIKLVMESKNRELREDIAASHFQYMHERKFEEEDLDEAHFHGELALRFGVEHGYFQLAHFGYIFFAHGQKEQAESLLSEAIEMYEKGKNPVAHYNLAVLETDRGHLERAIELFKFVADKAKDLPKADNVCNCLFVLGKDENGEISLTERSLKDIHEASLEALEVLETVAAM